MAAATATGSAPSLLGAEVEVVTVQGEKVTGSLYSCSDTHKFLAISQKTTKPRTTDPNVFDLRFFSYDVLESVTAVPGKPIGRRPEAGHLNVDEMNKRIRAAVQDAQRQLQSYSETASDDARAVFQAMTKLGKCQWHANDAILFNHMVLISAPYTSKNVKPVNKDGQDMATYVAERVAQLRK